MLHIGIDLGTSAVKLLLVDAKGSILKTISREYSLSFPRPGWSEQDPSDWLWETLTGIRDLTADCDKNQIPCELFQLEPLGENVALPISTRKGRLE